MKQLTTQQLKEVKQSLEFIRIRGNKPAFEPVVTNAAINGYSRVNMVKASVPKLQEIISRTVPWAQNWKKISNEILRVLSTVASPQSTTPAINQSKTLIGDFELDLIIGRYKLDQATCLIHQKEIYPCDPSLPLYQNYCASLLSIGL